jgi:hypothetical protein
MMTPVQTGIACGTLITLIAGAMVGLDGFFARKNHLKFLAMRTDQHILFDRLDREKSNLRSYEYDYGKDCETAPQDKKEICDETKNEIEKINKRIEQIPGEVEKMY